VDRFLTGARKFTLLQRVDPASYSVGTGSSSSCIKWPGLKLTTQVKNEWSYVSTLPYAFMPCRQKLRSVTVQFLCCWGLAVHSKAEEETLVNQVADGQTNTHEEGTSSEWFILCCCCLWMQLRR